MSRSTLRAVAYVQRRYCSVATLSLAEAPGCPYARAARQGTTRPTSCKSASSPPVAMTVTVADASSKIVKSYDQVPSPKSWPIVGTTFDLIRAGGAEHVHEYCDKRHKSLGPIYKETMGNQEFVFLSDAQLIQKVYQSEGKYPVHMVPEPWTLYNQKHNIQRGLFFMDGPEWRERRKSLNKVFLKKQTVSQYSQVFNHVISDLLNGWSKFAVSTKEVEPQSTSPCSSRASTISHQDGGAGKDDLGNVTSLERELYNWSIESLGAMIFGRRLGCLPSGQDGEPSMQSAHKMHEFVECVQKIFTESAKLTMIPPKLAKALNLPVWRRFETAASQALELARSYVKDNVHLLNGTQGEAMSGCPLHGAQGVLKQMTVEENIEQDEVVRIITDLFIAAADTTSHATQWALYLLSRHPESQEKIYNEVTEALGDDTCLQEHHLAKLPYVKGVIKEALRLYPVAPFLTRRLDEDIILDGYRIPAGKMIVMSLYTTGRSEEYYSEPNNFQPERWIRKDKKTTPNNINNSDSQSAINSYAYLPFGFGARACIGRRVAEMQMQFLLSRVVQRFKIQSGNEKEVGIKLRMITTPEEPIQLKLESRDSSSRVTC
ncbi:Mitochondrial cytochrome P450 -like protein [Halotydeus destructor]|nr:Mitochondrial cytochrome P450 -like protein [Halotydeus destructor]